MPILSDCAVSQVRELSEGTISLSFVAEGQLLEARAGQFLHVKCGEVLLRRPISVCDVVGREVTMVFEIRGEGTRWLAQRRVGDVLSILGPLGNGFDLGGKKMIVVGGGIGVPPLYCAAKKRSRRGVRRAGFPDEGPDAPDGRIPVGLQHRGHRDG